MAKLDKEGKPKKRLPKAYKLKVLHIRKAYRKKHGSMDGWKTRHVDMVKEMNKCIGAYWESGGSITQACASIGALSSRFSRWYHMYEPFANIIDSINDEFIDYTEFQLKKNIRNQDMEAIKYFLNSKGKHRGYGMPELKLKGDKEAPLAEVNNYFTGVQFIITDEVEEQSPDGETQ